MAGDWCVVSVWGQEYILAIKWIQSSTLHQKIIWVSASGLMVMLDVIYKLPTSRLVAQATWLGPTPKVGSHQCAVLQTDELLSTKMTAPQTLSFAPIAADIFPLSASSTFCGSYCHKTALLLSHLNFCNTILPRRSCLRLTQGVTWPWHLLLWLSYFGYQWA